mmetsp:Transcript_55412/g.63622  ORF Transcript_55412/g.63622 Transcript_55412/m.63622 type:complete len:98 (+) Transcript_55412:324-617(+)
MCLLCQQSIVCAANMTLKEGEQLVTGYCREGCTQSRTVKLLNTFGVLVLTADVLLYQQRCYAPTTEEGFFARETLEMCLLVACMDVDGQVRRDALQL